MDNNFKNPESIYRPAPFWSWNDDLQDDELVRQINEMAEKGWGGYFCHSRVGLITPYLSDTWMNKVKVCAEEARKTNTSAWLYDEDKWPSGFAGGLVPEAGEEHLMKGIRSLDKDDIRETDKVIASYSEDGRNYIITTYLAPMGSDWFNGTNYVDLLKKETVEKFLEVTIESYKKSVGQYFGKEIPGIFTDEPGYFNGGHIKRNEYLLPWTDEFPSYFEKERGYNIIEHLPSLFFSTGNYRKIRYDFFRTITKMFVETFTKTYYERCVENNLKLVGHFDEEDTLESQAGCIGAAMPHYEYMSWPGIDKLAHHVEQTVTVKQVSSASEQLKKERTFSEVFGCTGQNFSFKGRRWLHNWEAALGVNFVNHHLSLYTMAGTRKRDYPPNFFYQQPWWEDEKHLSDYFGRLSYALTRGKRVIDTLVIHPISSAWAEYDVRSYQEERANPCTKYDKPFEDITNALLEERLDFHYGDESLMEKHATVENGKIVFGDFRYSYVIVPKMLTISKSTLSLLDKFYEEGGKLIFTYDTPIFVDMDKNIDCKTRYKNATFAKEKWEMKDCLLSLKKDTFTATDKFTMGNAKSLFLHERELENNKRIVFLTNTYEEKNLDAIITIPYKGKVTLLSLDTGEEIPYEIASLNGEKMVIEHNFDGGEGLMLQIETDKEPTIKKEKPIERTYIDIENFVGVSLNENAIRVDIIDFYEEGKLIYEEVSIYKALHYFNSMDEGKEYSAKYRFNIKEKPSSAIRLVIERASNLQSITLNGKDCSVTNNYYLDKEFRIVETNGAEKEGINEIEIKAKKVNNIVDFASHRRVSTEEYPTFRPTELEPIYIIGDFNVESFNNEEFFIAGNKKEITTADIADSGYMFYAGRISLKAEVSLPKTDGKLYIEVGGVYSPCVEVLVNDKKVAKLYWKPFKAEITEYISEGKNSIELIFPTDLFNLTGPNTLNESIMPTWPGWTGPGQFDSPDRWTKRLFFNKKGIDSARIVIEK